MSNLVPMTKDGETIGVHETCVADHRRVGWVVGGTLPDEAAKPAGPAGLEAMTIKELQALAAEKGIDLGDATKKADIIAAVEAAKPANEQ